MDQAAGPPAESKAQPSPTALKAAGPHPLLQGHILPTLLRLALPNVLAMVTAVLVGLAEISYIGALGTEPLAAMAIVFPFIMLTQMMSSGAMGGGVSSAVSRALGAGDLERAEDLAAHAVLIGSGAGLLYSGVFLIWGPLLYEFLGGRGRVLSEATIYSNVFFLFGATALWLNNTLLSLVRGTGNMVLPSVTLFLIALMQIAIGGTLGLGLGPVPQLGMAGVALGQVFATAVGVALSLWFLLSGRGRLRLRLRGIAFRRELFADILKVGALACLSPLQSVATVLIFTALVAHHGTHALAGYGIGARLEFLLIPIAFGVGVAAVPMVGLAIGSGNAERARRVAWTAGAMSGGALGLVGVGLSFAPRVWAALFTDDPQVMAQTESYLRLAGPGFGFYGAGLTLYFASQGAGKVLGPVICGTLRLLIVALGGLWLLHMESSTTALFALVGISMTAYGLSTIAVVYFSSWRPRQQGSR